MGRGPRSAHTTRSRPSALDLEVAGFQAPKKGQDAGITDRPLGLSNLAAQVCWLSHGLAEPSWCTCRMHNWMGVGGHTPLPPLCRHLLRTSRVLF